MVRFVDHPDGTYARLADDQPKAAGPASGVKASQADGTTVTPEGRIVARFAQLSVVDLDGDVTVSGAIGAGQDVLISQWGHGSWQPGLLPVGSGRVAEEGGFLVLRGAFFMDSPAGRATFAVVKGLGPLARFSYGYNIPDGGSDRGSFGGQFVRFLRRLDIHEVSPVLRAAGIGTGVVQMSSLDPAQLAFANAARHNERELLALQGFTASRRKLVGSFEGLPVYVSASGRK